MNQGNLNIENHDVMNHSVGTVSLTAISRDEMNLAEFPLTVLSTRVDSKLKTLEFRDVITGKNGKPVAREWIITGADKFGLPTASDDEVLLGLLKLTVNYGFQSQKIFFTRYELLQILRWTTEGRSYSRLQKALDRLSGVRIKATNAFYDNESKSHSTKNFGIIDAYEINDGRDNSSKKSFFIWSSEIFKSFQAGFIKKLDLEFYQNLTSAIAKRLYRYLDKNFWYRSRLSINLFTLAHEKIGVSRNYQYASSIRQQIDPALDELKAAGFISSYEYLGKGRNTEIIVSATSTKPRSLDAKKGQSDVVLTGNKKRPTVEHDFGAGNSFSKQSSTKNTEQELIEKLLARGIAVNQAEKIILEASVARRERINQIIDHVDQLLKTQGNSIKSPVGFLYRAVSEPEKFTLPKDKEQHSATNNSYRKTDVMSIKAAQESGPTRQKLYEEFQENREAELDGLMDQLEPRLYAKLEAEVLLGLNKLSGIISADRLQQVVVHSIRQKVANLFVLPSFEEWLQTCKK